MNKFESFERARESQCTDGNEIVECEQCADNFERPIESDYRVCSKKCFNEARAEFHGDV